MYDNEKTATTTTSSTKGAASAVQRREAGTGGYEVQRKALSPTTSTASRVVSGVVNTVMPGAGTLIGAAYDYLTGGSGATTEGTQPTAKGAIRAGAEAGSQVTELQKLMAKDRLTADEIKTARDLIAKEPADKQPALFAALQSKPAYASQRDNASTTAGANQDNMCNLTSLAMCLGYLGIANPGELDGVKYAQFEDYLEALRVKKGYGSRLNASVLKSLAKDMGAADCTELIFFNKMTKKSDWSTWNDSYLKKGYALLMSIGGHIVRAQGVTDTGLVVDDPYGTVKLKAATDTDSNHWSYDSDKKNTKGAADTKGEDNTWLWADVEAHMMKWMMGIK